MVADDADCQRSQDDAQSNKNMPANSEKKISSGNQRLTEMFISQAISVFTSRCCLALLFHNTIIPRRWEGQDEGEF